MLFQDTLLKLQNHTHGNTGPPPDRSDFICVFWTQLPWNSDTGRHFFQWAAVWAHVAHISKVKRAKRRRSVKNLCKVSFVWKVSLQSEKALQNKKWPATKNTNSTNYQPPKKNKSHPHLCSWCLKSHLSKVTRKIEEPRVFFPLLARATGESQSPKLQIKLQD